MFTPPPQTFAYKAILPNIKFLEITLTPGNGGGPDAPFGVGEGERKGS